MANLQFKLNLFEGANEFSALSKLDGQVTGESTPVSITLRHFDS